MGRRAPSFIRAIAQRHDRRSRVWWVPDPQTGRGGPLTLLAGNSFCLAGVAFLLLVGLMLLSRTPIRLPAGRIQRTGHGS
jgi:hypothetical protein